MYPRNDTYIKYIIYFSPCLGGRGTINRPQSSPTRRTAYQCLDHNEQRVMALVDRGEPLAPVFHTWSHGALSLYFKSSRAAKKAIMRPSFLPTVVTLTAS